ncbi:cobyrinate a,c-diamide synthase, partial [Thermodesulfobacteriota bacterium]
TAQMAKWIGLPVLLIVDARSMARSAAALVQGFERFDPDITYAGALFNNIGSDRHLAYLKEALQGHVDMPCLGGIHRDAAIAIPERHLGLVTQEDHPWSEETIDQLAGIIEKSMDVQKLYENLPDLEMPGPESEERKHTEIQTVRIGLPMDNAFCFYYADNLDILASYGAEIVCFSPLSDADLPENLDGLYLGGGYPELFSEQLSENTGMRQQIKEYSMEGMPIYGECGGFMYLCSKIRTTEGKQYPMAGCFPFVTTMFDRLKSLGYREITLTKDTIIGTNGQSIRGHEFHYSEITEFSDNTETAYQVSPRKGLKRIDEGFMVNNTLGSYTHLHFGSFPDAAGRFVASCLKYKQKKGKTS